jgi:hypothetical protein
VDLSNEIDDTRKINDGDKIASWVRGQFSMRSHELSSSYKVLFIGVVLVSALVMSHLLYRFFIVPILSEFKQVPSLVWLAIYLPFFVAIFWIGFQIKSLSQFVAVSLVSVILTQGYLYILAIMNEPEHLKSYAVEAPLHFWTIGCGIMLIVYVVVYGVVLLLGHGFKHYKMSVAN